MAKEKIEVPSPEETEPVKAEEKPVKEKSDSRIKNVCCVNCNAIFEDIDNNGMYCPKCVSEAVEA